MPESTTPHLGIDGIRPRVDFACSWRTDARVWFKYRVPSHQFLLVESGVLRARTPNHELVARAGDLLCLRRETRNEYGFDGAVSYWETHIAFAPPPHEATRLWLEGEPIPDHIPLGEHAGAARRAFETFCIELGREGDLHRLRVGAAVYELLAAITAALGREPSRRPRADPWQRARARLEANLARPLTLVEVARELGVGEDHFIRGFRRRFGMSPMAYRNQARLRAAAVRLSGGEQAVKEVARAYGFADASAFARAFRRQFGLAPSDLRIAGELPAPQSEPGDLPYPVNQHIRPPGLGPAWFTWG
jgi:AraC-like DNA-binding protein